MAQIIIREQDNTSNPASEYSDVVFVPGLVHADEREGLDEEYYNKPVFFSSLTAFENIFGKYPAKFATGSKVNCGYDIGKTTRKDFFTEGEYDPGFLYAREMLSLGLPIYYQAIKGDKAQDVYDAMIGKGTTDIEEVVGAVAIADCQNKVKVPVQVLGAKYLKNDSKLRDVHFYLQKQESTKNATGKIELTISDYSYEVLTIEERLVITFPEGATATYETEGGVKEIDFVSKLTNVYVQVGSVYNIVGQTVAVPSIFSRIADRGTYNVKYITSGGYPTFEYDENSEEKFNSIVDVMLKIAGAKNNVTNDFKDDPYDTTGDKLNGRGDCVALIDHFNFPERKLIGAGSVFETINSEKETNKYSLVKKFSGETETYLSYGAIYTPYAKYSLSDYAEANKFTPEYKQVCLPGSFAYLMCLAKSLGQTLATYESIAGVARGTVPNIVFNSNTNRYEMCTDDILTNFIANQYNIPIGLNGDDDWVYLSTREKARISINGITEINPYGMIIYGDRTLFKKTDLDGVKATGIVNIRNMVSDIKKQVYVAARRYVFSQNNAALWFNFKQMITPLLDKFKSGYGIESYSITKIEGKSDSKYAIYASISIVPIYPVEKFDITINITDADVTTDTE